MKLAIKSKKLISPLREIPDAVILVDGEKIISLGKQENVTIPEGYEIKDVGDRIVAPGLVDIHNHGANGHFAREGEHAIQEACLVWSWTGCQGVLSP